MILGTIAAEEGRADEALEADASGQTGATVLPQVPAAMATGSAAASGEAVLFLEHNLHSTFFSITRGYIDFANLLTSNGYVVSRLTTSITADALSGIDVLVIPPPLQIFSPDEVAVVLDFVAAGGGLFLISDTFLHITTGINSIAVEYGITSHPGDVLDPTDNSGPSAAPIIYVFGSHAIVSGLDPVHRPSDAQPDIPGHRNRLLGR